MVVRVIGSVLLSRRCPVDARFIGQATRDTTVAAPAIVNTADIDGAPEFGHNTIELHMPPAAAPSAGPWRLSAFISGDDLGRAQANLVASAYRQFHSLGLEAVVVMPNADRISEWIVDGITLQSDDGVARRRLHVSSTPALVLENAAGQVLWRHEGFTAPGDLGLALRSYLGNPGYRKLISEP